MKFKNIIFSGDLLIATLIALGVYFFTPHALPIAVVKDIIGVAVAVIAITFAVFVASFAIIISASDNEFVSFLEQSGGYTQIIKTTHYALLWQFAALIFAMLLYGGTAFAMDNHLSTEPKLLFVIYAFIFFYSLFASMYSTLDTVKYADARARFLRLRHPLTDLEHSHVDPSDEH